MERWASINVEDVHLASIRIYHPPPESPNQKPRIILFLPPNHDPTQENGELPPRNPKWPVFETATTFAASGSEPDCYELEMMNDNVENQIVVAERPKDHSLSVSAASNHNGAHNSRARTTILTGRIKHECNLRPSFSKKYRRQMKERVRKSNTPLRQIRMIEDAGVPGGRGGVNRLSSGVGMGAGAAFSDLVVRFYLFNIISVIWDSHLFVCQKTRQKPAKGTFERMARMPRNQLLDNLFALFQDQPRWGIRVLREKTQQPEAYLKETLSQIAFLHKSGEFNGLWELQENFKSEGVSFLFFFLGSSGKMANGLV